MRTHHNPRARLPKRPSPDNSGPDARRGRSTDLDGLIYLLRDNLGKADAFISAAEHLIEESCSGTDDDPADEDEVGGSASHRRSRAEHLIEAGKLAVRAAAYSTEEIDRRRSGA